jgi:hypothetical protein
VVTAVDRRLEKRKKAERYQLVRRRQQPPEEFESTFDFTRERIRREADPVGFLIEVMRGKRQRASLQDSSQKRQFLVFPTLDQRLKAASILAAKVQPDLKAIEAKVDAEGKITVVMSPIISHTLREEDYEEVVQDALEAAKPAGPAIDVEAAERQGARPGPAPGGRRLNKTKWTRVDSEGKRVDSVAERRGVLETETIDE